MGSIWACACTCFFPFSCQDQLLACFFLENLSASRIIMPFCHPPCDWGKKATFLSPSLDTSVNRFSRIEMGIDIRHGNIFWEEEGISDSARGGYGSLFTHEIFVSQNDNVWASILCTAKPGLRCFTLYFFFSWINWPPPVWNCLIAFKTCQI